MQVKVLVVDDSGFFRRRVTEILGQDPDIVVVGTASNGQEAVDKAQQLRPDVITMDYEMPLMDGIQTTKVIRACDEPWNNIPIVALTAHAMEGHSDIYLAAGMNGFVSKPFKIDLLVEAIARAMSGETPHPKKTAATPRRVIATDEASAPGEALQDMLDELDRMTG